MALVFGKYEKIRRIAQGGMGEVFLARQVGVLDRLVILKALRQDLATEQEFVDQFLDEARVAATLNHPNIVAIYDVGESSGTYFIAMEYVAGEDLSRLWYAAAKAGVGLPFQVSVRICFEAALGLDHAHRASDLRGQALSIVHRDVSPQNIMVRGDGVTKLVDFGIAKAANKASRTQAGMVKGKLQYMSPEQVRGESLDGRSDQFSLGVVLWEMCTGRRLFKAESESQTIQKILAVPIPRPSQHVPGFPPELESVIAKMLERDRTLRFPTLGEVATRLKEYLDRATLQSGEITVTHFVQQILGKELEERIRDLTPMETGAGHRPVDGDRPRQMTQPGPHPPPSDQAAATRAFALPVLPTPAIPGRALPEHLPHAPMPLTTASLSAGLDDLRPAALPLALTPPPLQWVTSPSGVRAQESDPTMPGEMSSLDAVPSTHEADPHQTHSLIGAGLVLEAPRFVDPGPPPGSAPLEDDELPVPPPHTDPDLSPSALTGLDPAPAGSDYMLGHLPQGLTGTWGAPNVAHGEQAGISMVPMRSGLTQRRIPLPLWVLTGVLGALVVVGFVLRVAAPDLLTSLVSGETPTRAVAHPRTDSALEALRNDDVPTLQALVAAMPTGDNVDVDALSAAALLHTGLFRIATAANAVGAQALDPEASRRDACDLARRAVGLAPAQPEALLADAACRSLRPGDGDPSERLQALQAVLNVDGGPSTDPHLQGSDSLRHEADAIPALAAALGALFTDDAARTAEVEKLRAFRQSHPLADRRPEHLALVLMASQTTPPGEVAAMTEALVKKSPGDPRGLAILARQRAAHEEDAGPGDTATRVRPGIPPGMVDAASPTAAPANAGSQAETETYDSAVAKAERLAKAGRSSEASRFFKKALELKRGDNRAQVGLGWATLDLGRNDAAAKHFKAVLGRAPAQAEAWFGLGEALRALGNTTEAITAYQRYLELAPDGGDAGTARNAIQALQ